MGYELQGSIKVIMDTQTFPSGFSKREFVVTVQDGRFPQEIKLTCMKEKADLLNQFAEGDPVIVNFDLRGNEYKGRYYVDLNAWKISRAGGGGADTGGGGAPTADGPPVGQMDEPPSFDSGAEGDEIPF